MAVVRASSSRGRKPQQQQQDRRGRQEVRGDVPLNGGIVKEDESRRESSTSSSSSSTLAFFCMILVYLFFFGLGQSHVCLLYFICSGAYWSFHAVLGTQEEGHFDTRTNEIVAPSSTSNRRRGILCLVVSIFVQWLGGSFGSGTGNLLLVVGTLVAFCLLLMRSCKGSNQYLLLTAFIRTYWVWSLARLVQLTSEGVFWLHFVMLLAYLAMVQGSAATQLKVEIEKRKQEQQRELNLGTTNDRSIGKAKKSPIVLIALAAWLEKVTVKPTKQNMASILRYLTMFIFAVLLSMVIVPVTSRLHMPGDDPPSWTVPFPWEDQTLDLQEIVAAGGGKTTDDSQKTVTKDDNVFLCTRSVENPIVRLMGGIHSVTVVNGYVWENYPDSGGTGVPLVGTTWINASACGTIVTQKLSHERKDNSSSCALFDKVSDARAKFSKAGEGDGVVSFKQAVEEVRQHVVGALAIPPAEFIWGTEWNAVRTFPVRTGGDQRKWYRCTPMGSLVIAEMDFSAVSSSGDMILQDMLTRLLKRYVDRNERYNLIVKPSNCHNVAQEILSHTASLAPTATPDVTTRFLVLVFLLLLIISEMKNILRIVEAPLVK